MGTGKTSVGREVARRLGRLFVDMDAEIEAPGGQADLRLFAEQGEAAFRQMEARLVPRAVHARGELVIATGGGTLVDPANRRRA